jgi:hypothetical protein
MTPILDAHGRAWKLVPVEATVQMLTAGAEKLPDYDPGCDNAEDCYNAMLQAAPVFQAGEGLRLSLAEALRGNATAPWDGLADWTKRWYLSMADLAIAHIFGGKHE